MGISARRGRELEAERKRLESILPVELRHVFEESDIDLTWEFLHKVFHLNIEKWKAQFEYEFGRANRDLSRTEIFVRFGREHFEPPLRRILFRDPYDEIWFIILKHIVRKKLEEKRKESIY